MSQLPTHSALNPITEDDIAQFLINTPDFFERHAPLLATVQLSSPHGNRAVSLQERQAQMLREKIKGLERHIMDMVRHGNENVVTANRLHSWACNLLSAEKGNNLPATLTRDIQSLFRVPQVALRIWNVHAQFAQEPFAQSVSADTQNFANEMSLPYCGANAGFDAVHWLAEPAAAASIALLPLRKARVHTELGTALPHNENLVPTAAFGLLVLASSDEQRFHAGIGTEFLEQLSALASAALAALSADQESL